MGSVTHTQIVERHTYCYSLLESKEKSEERWIVYFCYCFFVINWENQHREWTEYENEVQ